MSEAEERYTLDLFAIAAPDRMECPHCDDTLVIGRRGGGTTVSAGDVFLCPGCGQLLLIREVQIVVAPRDGPDLRKDDSPELCLAIMDAHKRAWALLDR